MCTIGFAAQMDALIQESKWGPKNTEPSNYVKPETLSNRVKGKRVSKVTTSEQSDSNAEPIYLITNLFNTFGLAPTQSQKDPLP